MEGAATRTILEYLIICLKSEEERQLKGLALEGIVLVSIDLSDSTRGTSQRRCTTTIAAAGNFCSRRLNEQIWKEMDGMLAELSVPWTRPWTAGGCSHEPLDSTAFQLAFEGFCSNLASSTPRKAWGSDDGLSGSKTVHAQDQHGAPKDQIPLLCECEWCCVCGNVLHVI
ncbi:unnamed protein product [Lepidochelys olivacea]